MENSHYIYHEDFKENKSLNSIEGSRQHNHKLNHIHLPDIVNIIMLLLTIGLLFQLFYNPQAFSYEAKHLIFQFV